MILNPKKELYKWKVEAVPYFSYPTACSITFISQKRFGFQWPKGYFIFTGKDGYWYSEVDDVHKEGIKAYNAFWLTKGKTKLLRKIYNQDVKNLLTLSKKADPDKLKKLNDKEFIKLYNQFLKLYYRFWTVGGVPELAAYGSGHLLETAIRKQYSEPDATVLIRVLSLPQKPSFFLKEQVELLKLGKEIWNRKFLRRLMLGNKVKELEKELSKNHLSLYKKLQKHQQKYFWILNGYYGARYLKNRYFLQELANQIDIKNSPQKLLKKISDEKKKLVKERIGIIKKYQPEKDIIGIGLIAGQSTSWQDERKAINLQANHFLDIFLEDISRRANVPRDQLKYLIQSEIISLINGEKSVLTKIPSRKRMCAFEFDKKNFKFLEEKETKKITKKLESLPKDIKSIKEIKGLVVSIKEKIVRGKVRVLKSPNEVDKLKPGEILVTIMTSPDYILAIKKAKAIITDEGGLTSHAAIVSREFGKTCIVSTKIATKVLKDGDTIEINTNRGIVRIIKRI